MATPLKVGDVVRVTFVSRFAQQLGLNVVHYVVGAITGTSVTDQNAASVLGSNANPLYKAWMPQEARFEGVRVQIVRPTLAPAVVDTTAATPGAQITEVLPTMAALLVSIRTALAGRSGRGRAYLPFFTEPANMVTGIPSAGALTQAEAWAQGILTPRTVTGAGGSSAILNPVVYSRKLGTTTVIERWIIRANWATQRRRSQINRGDVLVV